MIARSTKLTRGERRESLLDAATELLGAGGPGAVTMEGVAAAAGVTKALPYRHFPNADAVLVALVERFNLELAARIVQAIDAAGSDLEAKMAAAVNAYFRVVGRHGHVLAQLAPTPGIRAAAAVRQNADDFLVELFSSRFDVPRSDARAVADVVIGCLNGGVSAWAQKRAGRRRLESITTAACVAVIRTFDEETSSPNATR